MFAHLKRRGWSSDISHLIFSGPARHTGLEVLVCSFFSPYPRAILTAPQERFSRCEFSNSDWKRHGCQVARNYGFCARGYGKGVVHLPETTRQILSRVRWVFSFQPKSTRDQDPMGLNQQESGSRLRSGDAPESFQLLQDEGFYGSVSRIQSLTSIWRISRKEVHGWLTARFPLAKDGGGNALG